MKLLLATKNRDKVREIQAKLKGTNYEILTLDDISNLPDVVEDKETLQENSYKKAFEIYQFTKILTLADDTGLEVEYLNNRPGVYSARYAGEDASYEMNNQKLLQELAGVPISKRTARFKCVMTLFSDKYHFSKEGVLEGRIATDFSGNDGFGYDPIFYPKGFDKTLAELTVEEKNKISHRGRALDLIIEVLKEIGEQEVEV